MVKLFIAVQAISSVVALFILWAAFRKSKRDEPVLCDSCRNLKCKYKVDKDVMYSCDYSPRLFYSKENAPTYCQHYQERGEQNEYD